MSADPLPTRDSILTQIRAFVAQWFRDGREEGLGEDTPLVTSGIVDSAGVLEVVEFLESRFGVQVSDQDVSLRNCNTLRALTALVEARL
ncbi:MAG: acyl carrier protein [Planctomycetes bacterium]|nr:acyl carrier protein [Planctomycetota bacterium]